jgi:hypothetical protein
MTLWAAATMDAPAGTAPANLSQGQPAEIDDQRTILELGDDEIRT